MTAISDKELQEWLKRNPDLSLQRFERPRSNAPEAAGKAPKRRKYGNRPTRVGERVFDSKKEAERFVWLASEAQAGRIRDLTCQPRFELLPAFLDASGASERGIVYVGDFMYTDVATNTVVVEDVKSEATARNAVFKLKWKWVRFLHRNSDIVFVIV